MPGFEGEGDDAVFTRTIQIAPSAEANAILICDVDNAKTSTADKSLATVETSNDTVTAVGLGGAPAGAKLEAQDGRVMLTLPASTAPATFKISLWQGAKASAEKVTSSLQSKPQIADLSSLTKGGPARFAQTVETQGVLSTKADPYVVDTITIPFENPYNSKMRLGGMDFFKDGHRAAVSTWNGDVWVVSGIDEKLDHVVWKRVASGMFQTLGLKIVDDVIYVLGRDQITRLHDLNGDGEADFYENFNNDSQVTGGFHEFAFDLQTDTEGNFYYGRGGPVNGGGRGFMKQSDNSGCILKVSKDGSKFEVFATGTRAPNGLGAGPDGEITNGDNEGSWVPSSRVNFVHKGDFLGVSDTSHMDPKPDNYGNPVIWLPHNGESGHPSMDNSCGGQAFVTSDKWGPYKGDLLHLSYGTCSLFHVMYEKVGNVYQGAFTRFPLSFESGTMRAPVQSCRWPALHRRPEGLANLRGQGRDVPARPLHRQARLHPRQVPRRQDADRHHLYSAAGH